MIELRSSYPHPYQWAPFILVGKPKPGIIFSPLYFLP